MSELRRVFDGAAKRDGCRINLYLELRAVAPKTSQRLRMMASISQAFEAYCHGLIAVTSDYNHPKFTDPWACCPHCGESTCPNRFLFRESHG